MSSILIVSDSAQAHGTEIGGRDIGSLDHMNCYSFYPSKSMTTAEGGIVTTNNKELYKLGCLIRSHGDDEKHHHVMLGLNYRMTEIAAVIGLNQLSELDDFLKRRRSFGKILRTGIERMDGLHPQKIIGGVNHSYSHFTVVMDLDQFNCTRDEFLEALRAENIASAVHYPTPLTKQPAILNLMKLETCLISEETSRKIFSLPMHSRLTDEELTKILAGVEKIVNHFHK